MPHIRHIYYIIIITVRNIYICDTHTKFEYQE